MCSVSLFCGEERLGQERGEGRASGKEEETAQRSDLLQLHENHSRFEKGFGEIYCWDTCDSANELFCLNLPSCLGLPVPLSPATFEELNQRKNTVWKAVFRGGTESRLPGGYITWPKGSSA